MGWKDGQLCLVLSREGNVLAFKQKPCRIICPLQARKQEEMARMLAEMNRNFEQKLAAKQQRIERSDAPSSVP